MKSSHKKKLPDLSISDQELFLSYIEQGLYYAKDAQETRAPARPLIADSKKKRKNDFDARIDLHGLTRDDARSVVNKFLHECRDKKFNHVLIIHGKGSGVLQEEVKDILENSSLVFSYGHALAKNGGFGATQVRLAL